MLKYGLSGQSASRFSVPGLIPFRQSLILLLIIAISGVLGCTNNSQPSNLSQPNENTPGTEKFSYRETSSVNLHNWSVFLDGVSRNPDTYDWEVDLNVKYQGSKSVTDVSAAAAFGILESPQIHPGEGFQFLNIALNKEIPTLEFKIKWADSSGEQEGSVTYELLWKEK